MASSRAVVQALSKDRRPVSPSSTGHPEQFITEHYWGYARQRDGSTMEYQVEHPRWQVWTAHSAVLDCDVAEFYGKSFVPFLCSPPASAFLATGSSVTVFKGLKLV